ncbi:MAG TPA: acyl-CoA dehydrogenase family protein [Burkholderiaceae bacterium]|jgi:acyl-CoA dehydrogenase|nr:acyl-CoA dehydrogenase family protein [Burkholderiaceae bacterium]
MSTDQRVMLADTLDRLFRDHAPRRAAVSEGWNAALWAQLEDIGLAQLLVPEAAGGVGGDWEDAHVVAHAVGAHAVALPVGEMMLARALAARCGLQLAGRVVGLAATSTGTLELSADGGGRFTGSLYGVPWGRHMDEFVTLLERGGQAWLAAVPRAAAGAVAESGNPAGEPRDKLSFDAVPVRAVACAPSLARDILYLSALLRVGQIAGALQTVLAMSVAYARDRVQFGKPIALFQAVQQQLAVFAAEVAAAGCAARSAFRSAARGDAHFEIAAAKLRANLAIDTGTAIAHQVHGAIGFTREYELRHFTQRLWSWRSEFGNDRYWSEALGQAVIARGVDEFWADLTRRGDAAATAVAPDLDEQRAAA